MLKKIDFDQGLNNINLIKTSHASQKAAAEGIVLLKNENGVLPLKSGTKISVFGRSQLDYNTGGTGSGGSVNVLYVADILNSLRKKLKIKVNEELAAVYEEWIKNNPISTGLGVWAARPHFQKEMTVTSEIAAKAAEHSETALIIIGRTAGEEQDNFNGEGSYRLTQQEHLMLKNVTDVFDKTVVLLNTSNIIDMKWVDEYDIDSVLYIWQGGQEGGEAVADILCGDKCPSGRLTDTIANNYTDYPSSENFGSKEENLYREDIYVGYRYFETFAKDRVKYPFGFGLSYTDFKITCADFRIENDIVKFETAVKNVGKVSGKEVVQVYFTPPEGKINKPKIQLAAFYKTKTLLPGESHKKTVSFPMSRMSSFDDSGHTGADNRFCYFLEKGEYKVLIGKNVRDPEFCTFSFKLNETKIVKKCVSALAPHQKFTCMKGKPGGGYDYVNVPQREYDIRKRIEDNLPDRVELTIDKGYKLADVKNGKVSMDKFIGQLTIEDLACLVRGEGMGSKRVRPGTGCAFGGVSSRLLDFGIPVAAGTDGPSGLRFDNGDAASLVPIGTMLACTWNTPLVREVYKCIGGEMLANDIDLLLGPGMNIHRNPLCGRNFEYYSEDPYISGVMAGAAINGLSDKGVMGTLKHLAANNQETKRKRVNSVVSERAVREIYLKGLEYALEYSKPTAIMTSYNPLNGQWCGSNYDLTTTIIRNEFGYSGVIMTDWWASMNEIGSHVATKENTAAMLRSGTDIYMVVNDPEHNSGKDNTIRAIGSGDLTLGELQKAAKNICGLLINLPCMERESIVQRGRGALSRIKKKLIWWKC